jgi:hypothetical protein
MLGGAVFICTLPPAWRPIGGFNFSSVHIMRWSRFRFSMLGTAIVLASGMLVTAQSVPNEPRHLSGTSVTPAFEGWFSNPDGSYSFLLGYENRNGAQELDIPIGPDNRIDPGGPDRGQPTHFLLGRQWGMFIVKVPSSFGPGQQQKLTWTIAANGKPISIPFYLHPDYEISPLDEAGGGDTGVLGGNTPPVLGFDPKGPFVQGPLAMTTDAKTTLAKPLALTAWVSDDAKSTSTGGRRNLATPVSLTWTKYRGPGTVKFDKAKPEVETLTGKAAFNGKATTTVTFSQPGDYELHVTANDASGVGGGGFQCCWTTAIVKASVTP